MRLCAPDEATGDVSQPAGIRTEQDETADPGRHEGPTPKTGSLASTLVPALRQRVVRWHNRTVIRRIQVGTWACQWARTVRLVSPLPLSVPQLRC